MTLPQIMGELIEKRLGRRERGDMKTMFERTTEAGKAGWAFLWLIGVPIPVLLVLFLLRGCT